VRNVLRMRLTVRHAAREAGVSALAFFRVAQGDYAPDIGCLLLLANWVGVAHLQLPPDDTATSLEPARTTFVHNLQETTLESITPHR
jgi:hypothetical protein